MFIRARNISGYYELGRFAVNHALYRPATGGTSIFEKSAFSVSLFKDAV
jgi:hypothetical protein